jgi:hypothetical protein
MIPDNPNIRTINSTNQDLLSPFQYPDNIVSTSELEDWEYGGIALQDPTQGLRYQVWKGWWDSDDETAYLQPDDGVTDPIAIHTESNVEEFTFTFDHNMRWTSACRLDDDTVKFRWYDTLIEDYTTTTYSDYTSVRLAHDDKRSAQVNVGASDVILTYIRAGRVRWRIQRDRYLTEYTHNDLTVPAVYRITHFGMNTTSRLQWRLGFRRPK